MTRPTLLQARRELLRRCEEILHRCRTDIRTKATGVLTTKGTQELDSAVTSGSSTLQINVDLAVVSGSLLEFAQAQVIQEWHAYVDRIFLIGLQKCLSNPSLWARCPKINIGLSDLKWSKKTEIIQSICDSLEESVSWQSYDVRIKHVKKIFGATSAKPEIEINKHVKMRNICQHSRGVIRQDHLKKLGVSKISILDSNGQQKKLGVGRSIKWSLKEIEHLHKCIKQYSQHFERI